MDSDEEVSCDLPIEDDAGAGAGESEGSLDWSVSAISGAMDPDRFHSELSSAPDSPEKTRLAEKKDGDEIHRLAGQFKSIQANLQYISQRTVTPVTSPRRGEPSSNKEQIHVNVTPPVKDPGPGSALRTSRIPVLTTANISKQLDFSSSVTTQDNHSKRTAYTRTNMKFDQMRSALRDLEGSARNLKSAESKIPKPGESTSHNRDHKAKKASFYEKEYEEVNECLEKVTNKDILGTPRNYSASINEQLSQNEGNATVIAKATDDLETKNSALEGTVKDLQGRVRQLESHVKNLETSNSQKQSMISDLKSQWSGALTNWTKNQQELVDQLQESRREVDSLKLENASAKEQFMVCQDELAKAVQIASDFRQKLTEEEALKQDMLNQLLSERASKSKQFLVEQSKLQKAIEETHKLQQEMNSLKEDNGSLVSANAELSKKFHDKDVDFAQERSEMEKTVDSLRNELNRVQGERKTTESSLHTFYATQMETILSEKIESLQNNVQMWEKNLLRDKQDALNRLQNQHDAQVENIKKTIFEDLTRRYQDQLEEVNLALSASRKEADALREQVNLKHHRPVSTPPLTSSTFGNGLDASPRLNGGVSASERQEQIWREVLAQSRRHSQSTPKNSSLAVRTVQNNLHYQASSSAVNGGMASSMSADFVAKQREVSTLGHLPSYKNPPIFTSSESSPVMTKEEKRQVVQNFMKEYLEDNPDAHLDSRLMAGLNSMATNLVERTFEDKTSSPMHQQPRPQQPKRPSASRRKSTKK